MPKTTLEKLEEIQQEYRKASNGRYRKPGGGLLVQETMRDLLVVLIEKERVAEAQAKEQGAS